MAVSGRPVEVDAPLTSWTNYLKAFLGLIMGVIVFIMVASTQHSAGEGSIARLQKVFVTRISILNDHVSSINITAFNQTNQEPPEVRLKNKPKNNTVAKKKPGKSKGEGKQKGKKKEKEKEKSGKELQKVVKVEKGWEPKQVRFGISASPYEVYLHYTVIRPVVKCYNVSTSFGVNYQRKDGRSAACQFAVSKQVGCFIGDAKRSSWWFFMAKLSGLEPGRAYLYRIGSVTGNEASSLDLTATKGLSEFTWRRGAIGGTYLMFADMGDAGIKTAVAAAEGEQANLVIHAGDASYASNTGECFDARYTFTPKCGFNCTGINCSGRDRQADRHLHSWEAFFKTVKPFTDAMPFMTTMGNHDNDLTWFYKFRPPVRSSFPGVKLKQLAPGLWSSIEKMNSLEGDAYALQAKANRVMQQPYFYSFDDGLVHFIALGTEDNPVNAYEMNEVDDGKYGARYERRFAEHYGMESPQYKWLQEDLKAVDRTKTPWVVLYTHRPIYHSSQHHRACSKDGDWYGCAVRELYQKVYEQYDVDLVLSGHAHHYQRSFPLEQGKPVTEGKHGVIYVVCGVGGYRLDRKFATSSTSWIAYRHANYYGYCKFTPHNLTHLEWVHVAATSTGSKPLDRHWLKRQST